MTSKAKFLFQTRFDPRSGAEISSKPQKPATIRFTQEELDALSAQLRAEGHAQGMADAAAGTEGRVAAAAEAIQQRIAALDAQLMEHGRQMLDDSTNLAVAVGRKLASALMNREPAAEIEALVARCLSEMRDEPRIVIRANDAVVEALEGRINDLVAATGFHGKVAMLGDNTLPPTDCSIEWADGSAERNMHDIDQRIDQIIAHYVNGNGAA